MNIDLLPINAFALESCAAADAGAGLVHTLTLPLALGPALAGQEPMFGMASAELAARPTTTVLRAGVVAADGSEMTITF